MTATMTAPKKQRSNHHQKKQERQRFKDSEALQVPPSQSQTESEHESLSDWVDAT
ncbi:hypothetical protein [Chroococcidiopsis sp.]|uniref:hypothetical protein n=1 Tax=Chroococcidiopsis sp. TaxID=3088168 RepID=UPI003F3B18EB